ncbi:MAG: DUF58 domain-containing protein [Bdellovibrio sp.]|nr:DUF58 domain-containing protein [Bdellovibrio sp.]
MASKEAVNGPQSFKGQRPFLGKSPRTYILPTGFGLAFGLMALTLFFMAVGYANNLIYIFFFFLLSVALTGMVVTNLNVNAVDFLEVTGSDLIAGEVGRVRVMVANSSPFERFQIEAHFDKTKNSLPFSLGSSERSNVEVPFAAPSRGIHALPRLILQSKFPFGLLRAWRVFKEPGIVLVLPKRAGIKQFPSGSSEDVHLNSVGLFRDHRIYQSGDSVRRIDWKASARRHDILVKNFEEPEKPALSFQWQQTEGMGDVEARLSQLALWIDEAEAQRFEYSLHLGFRNIPASSGKEHWRTCMEALALAQPKELS